MMLDVALCTFLKEYVGFIKKNDAPPYCSDICWARVNGSFWP